MSTKNNSVITSNLKNQPFEYRKSLTLPKNINFGFELEMEGVNPERVLKLIKNLEGNWKIDSQLPVSSDEFIDEEGYPAVKVKWTSSYSGQFTLSYGDFEKVIVVESLF